MPGSVHEKSRRNAGLWKWPLGDLNPGPTDYESAALTAELRGLWVRTSLTL